LTLELDNDENGLKPPQLNQMSRFELVEPSRSFWDIKYCHGTIWNAL